MPIIAHAISPGLAALLNKNFIAKSFWRVLIINGGNGTTGASEVRFKNKGSSKPGSSLGSGGTHGNAFDDDTSTNWTITGEFGEYIGLEFSSLTDIDEIEIISLFNNNSNTLLDYEVQFSDDGIVWTTLWSSFGNPVPTSNGQIRPSFRPLAAVDGAAIVHQRAYVILGAAGGGAMINTQRAYAILGAAGDGAMINHTRAYAVLGVTTEASVNAIKVYAIYDAGS